MEYKQLDLGVLAYQLDKTGSNGKETCAFTESLNMLTEGRLVCCAVEKGDK